jgi:hypothetical protein
LVLGTPSGPANFYLATVAVPSKVPLFLCFHSDDNTDQYFAAHLCCSDVAYLLISVSIFALFCICSTNLLKFSKMSKYDMTGIGLNLREIPDDNGSLRLMVLGLILDGPAHSAGVRQVSAAR